MRANIQQAAIYLNECLDCDLSKPLLTLNDCVRNQNGIIEFRIHKGRWPRRDTQKIALYLITKVLGQSPTDATSTDAHQIYRWNIEPGRWLVLTWVRYEGTFIKLLDEENGG